MTTDTTSPAAAKPVRKAVIPAAGMGTRFLPATKAMPKEMLPVVDRPAIQYVVEEAVAAGLTDVLMITGKGKGALEDHFDRNLQLERVLEAKGDTAKLAAVRHSSDLARVHYVRQGDPRGLGHAVLQAEGHVGDEGFAVLLGDDLIDARDPLLPAMIAARTQHGGSVVALMEVPREQAHLYGCAAIDESADLARERGSYSNFEGSRWSQGLVPFDSIALTEADRGTPIKVDRTTRLDWDALRVKVKGGMRNATLMAIAPTASIGLVAGTTPGLDPQFSQIFSRSTSNGKFLEVNRNLVTDLQKLGIWGDVKEQILRSQGDIQNIDAIPDSLKAIYKTSFQLSPYSFLEVAARAQKWIDQSISRNMYLETRDLGDMMDIYYAAWERGVKTTYYLHMKPRHTAEQSTVKVNKAEDIIAAASAPASTEGEAPTAAPARRGFGGLGK